MDKAYDFKALRDKLKERGLDVAEDAAEGLVEDLFWFMEESAKLSENKFDDIALIILPELKKKALEAADKIDGEQDSGAV